MPIACRHTASCGMELLSPSRTREDQLSNALSRFLAEVHRGPIERWFAPCKLEIGIDCFELNPGKPDVVRFLNEHAED
jgi:hypothetical protein